MKVSHDMKSHKKTYVRDVITYIFLTFNVHHLDKLFLNKITGNNKIFDV